MQIPRYIVIKLEMTDKATVKATDVTDRCEVYEYEPNGDDKGTNALNKPQTDCAWKRGERLSTRRYMVRINSKDEVDENIIVGDVVDTSCYRGVVIGFTAKENGQYKIAVENGDIEDWINPEKVNGMHYELYTIGDIVNAVGDINKRKI